MLAKQQSYYKELWANYKKIRKRKSNVIKSTKSRKRNFYFYYKNSCYGYNTFFLLFLGKKNYGGFFNADYESRVKNVQLH